MSKQRTVGTLTYFEPIRGLRKRGTWAISGEPHMLMRAKRLFQGTVKDNAVVSVSHTGENAIDLEWFMERHPLEMSKSDRSFLKREANQARQRAEDTAAVLSGARKPIDKKPLEKPLRPYQETFVDFWDLNKRFLCADDLGVGKTVQAIGGLAQGWVPAVCVVPTHIQRQWRAKFHEFAPWLNVHIAKKGRAETLPQFANGRPLRKRSKIKTGERCHVLILNYHKLAGWATFIAEWANTIVYDEIHNLSRDGSTKFSSALAIASVDNRIVGMSNTPIRNYGGEMFNVLRVLGLQSYLGDREEFNREWCGRSYGNSEPLLNEPEAFVSHLKDCGLMLRRTAEECGLDVHEPEVIPFEVDNDPAALDQVEDAAEELARLILNRTAANFDRMQAASQLDWKLRQATGIGKAPYVAELVRMLIENGEKVVVGAWHREVYEVLKNRLSDYECVMYTGSESPAQKEASKKAFIEGDADVFLLSLRSGEGLDGLQYASRTIVFAELDWSWTALKQFMGRLARNGQEKKVLAYFADCGDGSDPIMMEKLGVKRDQLDRVIDPDKPVSEIVQVDKDKIRSLAMDWLSRKGKLEKVEA